MTISNQPSSAKTRSTFRLLITLAVLHLFFTAVLIVVGVLISVPEMLFTAIITGVMSIAATIAIILVRRGEVVTGIWILIAAIIVGAPLVSLITAGLGWISLFSIPIVVILLARPVLSAKHNLWA